MYSSLSRSSRSHSKGQNWFLSNMSSTLFCVTQTLFITPADLSVLLCWADFALLENDFWQSTRRKVVLIRSAGTLPNMYVTIETKPASPKIWMFAFAKHINRCLVCYIRSLYTRICWQSTGDGRILLKKSSKKDKVLRAPYPSILSGTCHPSSLSPQHCPKLWWNQEPNSSRIWF